MATKRREAAGKHLTAYGKKDYDSDEIKSEYALDDKDREVCQQIVTFGPKYLRQHYGWRADIVKRFLDRVEVQKYILTLKEQYEDRTGIQELTQFFAQFKINSMVPSATTILARALRGEYIKDGKTMPPPTKQQLEAAVQVLDRANIQGTKYAGNDNTPSIDARSINIAMGLGAGQNGGSVLDSQGRARVREVLNLVLNKTRAVADADKMVERKSVRDRVEKKFGALKTLPEDDDENGGEDEAE